VEGVVVEVHQKELFVNLQVEVEVVVQHELFVSPQAEVGVVEELFQEQMAR
jgi:hypothetical protein